MDGYTSYIGLGFCEDVSFTEKCIDEYFGDPLTAENKTILYNQTCESLEEAYRKFTLNADCIDEIFPPVRLGVLRFAVEQLQGLDDDSFTKITAYNIELTSKARDKYFHMLPAEV